MFRSTILDSLRHAFAVENAADLEPTPRQAEIVDRLCYEIASRGMTTPAIVALETGRPLNFIGSQAMHFFSPVISAVFDSQAHVELAKFLEHRGSVEYILKKLETVSA